MPVDPAPATYVGSILTAVRAFNQTRLMAILDEADATHGIDITIDEIVFPSLRVVGTFWSSGTVDVAHEHLLSTAVTRWIAAKSAMLPAGTRKGSILLSAGPTTLVPMLASTGLVDELVMPVHPAVITDGPRLFDDLPADLAFTLAEAQTFASGCVVLHYLLEPPRA